MDKLKYRRIDDRKPGTGGVCNNSKKPPWSMGERISKKIKDYKYFGGETIRVSEMTFFWQKI